MNKEKLKLVIPGGAGLVGQNLVIMLKESGYTNITVLDKHHVNLRILHSLHPDVLAVEADLSICGAWIDYLLDADVVVMLQAQIGGNYLDEFMRNNVHSTENIINVIRKSKKNIRLVHVSSSVVLSTSNDFYTNTKKEQEKLVKNSGLVCPILRPTLMFGFFDRKHLGWLSHFMKLAPIFPIPGNGKYLRQPLYVQDFCQIILACIENAEIKDVFNISGLDKIYYIDIIRQIREVCKSKVLIVYIPYSFFYFLLWLWSKFDQNPPFTTQQLEALCAGDEFEVIDWPNIFKIKPTPFDLAIRKTFTSSQYSNIRLEF